MAESEERPKLRGPLAPLRLFLSSGKAVGRAGKSLAGKGLQKVKRRGSRPGPLASVSAAHFARAQPEETSREDNGCAVTKTCLQLAHIFALPLPSYADQQPLARPRITNKLFL